MAGKVCEKSDLLQGSCKSKASKAVPVKVVHIANPKTVNATVSEFRSVVQSLTGRKRSSVSQGGTANPDMSSQCKKSKLEGGLKCCSIPRAPKPSFAHKMPTESIKSYGIGDGKSPELKNFRVQSKETSDTLNSQMFDTLESIGDASFFVRFPPHHFYDECI